MLDLPIVVINVNEYRNDDAKFHRCLRSVWLGPPYFLINESWNLRISSSASLVQLSRYRMFRSSVIFHSFSTVCALSLSFRARWYCDCECCWCWCCCCCCWCCCGWLCCCCCCCCCWVCGWGCGCCCWPPRIDCTLSRPPFSNVMNVKAPNIVYPNTIRHMPAPESTVGAGSQQLCLETKRKKCIF